jgi:hypothetical protein
LTLLLDGLNEIPRDSDDAYWPGRALAWRQGRIGQDAIQQYVRENRQIILDALGKDVTAEKIRDYYEMSLSTAKWWQERLSDREDVFDAWLLETYPPPAGPFIKPAYWRSLAGSDPAQPVVGAVGMRPRLTTCG